MPLIHRSLLIVHSCFLLCGCTYSVNLVHTEGAASDVVDETQSADPEVTTDLSLPLYGM